MIRTATFFEAVYFNVNNILDGIIGTFIDKTDEKELFDKLTKARSDAEAAARLKSEFLTTVSHEMRTPLTTILAMSEMLQIIYGQDDKNELYEILAEAAERLFELFENIIDASLLEEGKLLIGDKVFSPQDIYTDLSNRFRKIATDKKLKLSLNISKDLPYSVLGDNTRFLQVLKRILSNAIKFTQKGEVIIKADIDKNMNRTDNVIYLLTTISDSGIGIPYEKQNSIFDFFNQVDGSLTRSFNGSGIGLALSRRITELMGGTLELISKPGEGCRVTISIPFKLTLTTPHNHLFEG